MNRLKSKEPLSHRFKLRADLQWSPYSENSQTTWVARSPISLEYFYFSDLEKRLLQLFNGSRSLHEISKHPWAKNLGQTWIVDLAMKAQGANLLFVTDRLGLGEVIWRTKTRNRQRQWFQWLLSPLAVRIKLFDPTLFLEMLSPVAKMLFSRTLALLSLLIIPLVVYFVLVEFLRSGRTSLISDALGQLSSEQLLILLCIYLLIKSLHELGHALACRKWKAECHEIGIFFLVFAPCLYCDTTDSWKLNNRWKRAAIAAAGIYVEVLIAMVAAIVWLFTVPSSNLHWIAAYTMAIGSVSTVLVNANPLLRYDGYYILSDLWQVPNLADQSREALRAFLASFLTGQPMPKDRWDARPISLIVYQVAAKCYRLFLMMMIVIVVWLTLDRWGLRLIGILLVSMTLLTAFAGSMVGTTSFMKEVRMTGTIRKFRAWTLLAMTCVLAWVTLTVEWPTHVTARAINSAKELHPIYAKQTGRLTHFAPLGSTVSKGAVLINLVSPDLDIELLNAEGAIAELEEKLAQLRLAMVDDDQAAFELGDTIEQIAKNRARRDVLLNEIRSLSVTAEFDGKLLPSDIRPQVALTEADHLGIWNPILSENHINATVERGTLLGWLTEGTAMELAAVVTETETERLRPGMTVVCRWDCHVGRAYQGVVQSIGAEPLEDVPEILVGDSSFNANASASLMNNRSSRYYEVIVSVPEFPPAVAHNSLATVHFETASKTLWEIIYRFYSTNIRPRFFHQNRLAINRSNMGSAIVCAVRSLSDSVRTWSSCP